MTNDKKFIFHKSFYDSLKSLEEKDRLRFIEYIINYAFEGTEPELDGMELTAWIVFKSKLDEDKEKWEYVRQIRSEAGKKHKGNQYTRGTNGTSVPSDNNHFENGTNVPSKQANGTLVPNNGTSGTNGTNVPNNIANGTRVPKMEQNGTNGTINNNNITRNINITRNNNDDDDEEKKNCCSSSSFDLEFFRVDINSFVNEWNMVYDGVNSAKWKTPMQKIDELDAALPVDAQDRLDRLVCEIVQYIKTEDVDILYQKLCGKNFPEGYELTDKVVKALCNRVIERALLKLAWAKIKPKTSIFGSFVWFMKFDNVKKLINGEIV